RIDGPAGDGRDPRQALQEVEGRALPGEERARRAAHGGEARAGLGPDALSGQGLEARAGIELLEGARGDGEAGDHKAAFGDEPSGGRAVGRRAEQAGRDVVEGAVLGQRAPYLREAERLSQWPASGRSRAAPGPRPLGRRW